MLKISKKFSTFLFFLLPLTTNTFLSPLLNYHNGKYPLSDNYLKTESGTRLCAFDNENLNNESQEYILSLGKTLDILDTDYQKIFKQIPNFDIYTEDITLRDPSGIRLQGLPVYKSLIEMIHNIANLFIRDCFIDYRLLYRPERKKIEVNWKLEINFRLKKFPFYVQANSYYAVDHNAKIYNHVIDKLIINDQTMRPPYNIPLHYMQIWNSKNDKFNSKKVVPSFLIHFKSAFLNIVAQCTKVFEKLKICQTNEDCSFPLTCCDHSLLKTCCKEDGTRENLNYPHPYFKRPIRVKANYDKPLF